MSFPLNERLTNVAADLIRLVKSPRVGDSERAAVVSALGSIEPVFYRPVVDAPGEISKPEVGAIESVLKEQLQSNEPAVRRAAARALVDLIQGVTLFAEKYGTVSGTGAERLRSEQRKQMAEAYRIKSLAGIIEAATTRLNDSDAEVRRTCVDACKTVSAVAAFSLIPDRTGAFAPERFPPLGRPWTAAERLQIEERQRDVTTLRGLLAPLLEAYQKAVPSLAMASTANPDAGVRVEANHVLENLALTRQKLVRLEESIPKEKNPPEPEARLDANLPRVPVVFSSPNIDPSASSAPAPAQAETVAVGRPVAFRQAEAAADTLGASLRKALASVQQGLNDPDKKVRLAAIDALETMGDDAAPALPSLVQALSDSDKFVRWSAARVIGKLAPIQPSVAVPKLAELTADPDLDVRLAALKSLERYGPAAKNVVDPYLGNAATHGDTEARIPAMKALQAIGADAAAALPAVATNLNADDSRLRQSACETLGLIGPQVAQANPALWKVTGPKIETALRRALKDDEAEVRRAASDALLKVLGK